MNLLTEKKGYTVEKPTGSQEAVTCISSQFCLQCGRAVCFKLLMVGTYWQMLHIRAFSFSFFIETVYQHIRYRYHIKTQEMTLTGVAQ